MSLRQDFADFLVELANGHRTTAKWQKMVVTHYHDEKLEAIRREVVRLDIAGELTWANLERLASELRVASDKGI